MVLTHVDVEALFRENQAHLLRYLVRLSGNSATAEDVLQETFVRALERADSRVEHTRAWLFTVATNLVRDRARRSGRELSAFESLDPPPPSAPTPLEYSERQELQRRLRHALGQLNDRERTAIVMREEGFKHREIAEALGTTTGTVGTLLARAFDKLATLLPLDGVGQ